MSTHDVPGARVANNDVLAMGCWAEHDDGSLVFVYAVEAGRVVYSIFDVAEDPPLEWRDARPEAGFKNMFTWDPDTDDDDDNIRWTWHDKTPFPWERIMADFPAGQRAVSAVDTMTTARRLADRLKLRAQEATVREGFGPRAQRAASTIMQGLRDAIAELRA